MMMHFAVLRFLMMHSYIHIGRNGDTTSFTDLVGSTELKGEAATQILLG